MSAPQGRGGASSLPPSVRLTQRLSSRPVPLTALFPQLRVSRSSLSLLSRRRLHPAPLASPHLSLTRSSQNVAVVPPPPSLSSPASSLCYCLSECLWFPSLPPPRLDPAPTASAPTPRAGAGPVVPPARCSRTFITFSDDATFEEWFPQGRPPKVPVREVCPVTHRPALYRDPVTDIPYATARAFKIIREAYKKYITAHGLPPAASALGPGPPPPEPLPGAGPRALRQKIVIK